MKIFKDPSFCGEDWCGVTKSVLMRISWCCMSFNRISNLQKVLAKVKQSPTSGIDMASWFPATVSFNICGNGHESGFRNVVLTGDHKTYLFNCGEGFQRNIYLTK